MIPPIILFVIAALALLLVPGPAVLYIVSQGATQGRRGGLASVGGIELASLTHAVAAAFGLSAILLSSALAFDIVKYLGAAYLILLGLHTIFVKRAKNPSATELATPKKRPSRMFAQGYLVNLLNPKTALFFYAFLPQFVIPTEGRVLEQILALGVLFVALAFCTDSMYALTSSVAGQWFARKAGIVKTQRYITGSTYIILGLVGYGFVRIKVKVDYLYH